MAAASALALIVGPEGGITDTELAALTDAGAVVTRLGPTVLRTSTAAAVALGALGVLTPRWGEAVDLAIGDGYAVYRGPIGSGGPIHRHGAFQIVMSECGEVALVDPCGTRHQGPALVVAPMVPHRIIAAPDLVTYYIDPHCRFADRLRQRYQTGIAIAPELAQLRDQDIVDACRAPSHQLDPDWWLRWHCWTGSTSRCRNWRRRWMFRRSGCVPWRDESWACR